MDITSLDTKEPFIEAYRVIGIGIIGGKFKG